jgi:mannose-6-phosphate isomerase-like protein (cupin superfamily)
MNTMDAPTLEAIETDHGPSTAVRREVVAGPSTHIDVLTVPPGGEVGAEVHASADETLVVVAGCGEAELDGERTPVRAGSLVFIPCGTRHNVRNQGRGPLRLYAVHAATS